MAKVNDMVVPVATPYLLCGANILIPGLGTCISACVNDVGFNAKTLGLGLLIHFIFFVGFAQWPVHMFIACCVTCFMIACEYTIQTAHMCCCFWSNCTCCFAPVVHYFHAWFMFATCPARIMCMVSVCCFCYMMPDMMLMVCHCLARGLHMYHDYQTIKMSECKRGNGKM